MSEVVEAAIQAAIEDVHTVIPGRVVSYDGHAKRTASVQPVVRLPMVSGPLIDIAAIDGVPIVFPSTAAGSLLFPLAKGDGVLLLFSEVGIGRFLTSKAGTVSDPGAVGRHALHDAIAIPGLWSIPAVPSSAAKSDGVVLYSATGSAVELGRTIDLRNENSTLRAVLEKMYDDIRQLRTDLALNFSALATAITGDATFLAGTAGAATSAASVHQEAVAQVITDKTSLQELLT